MRFMDVHRGAVTANSRVGIVFGCKMILRASDLVERVTGIFSPVDNIKLSFDIFLYLFRNGGGVETEVFVNRIAFAAGAE